MVFGWGFEKKIKKHKNTLYKEKSAVLGTIYGLAPPWVAAILDNAPLPEVSSPSPPEFISVDR